MMQLLHVRPAVALFALAMETRLQEKDAERADNWKRMPLRELVRQAQLHMDLLRGSVAMQRDVVRSAVDVANYACFLAHQVPELVGSASRLEPWDEMAPPEFYDQLAGELERAHILQAAAPVLRELAFIERRQRERRLNNLGAFQDISAHSDEPDPGPEPGAP